MRLRALASACLVALLAACLPEKVPAAGQGRGHENDLPGVVAQPPAPAAPTQEAAAPARPSPALPGCRSIAERLASIVKAAPDATARRIPDGLAADYARSFNAVHGTSIAADQVAIVGSALWGDKKLVLFERQGCETGTKQVPLLDETGGEAE